MATEPISFETQLRQLATPVAVEYDSGEVVVAQVLSKNPKKIQVRVASRTSPSRDTRHREDITLGELALSVRQARPIRAFSLPRGKLVPAPQPRGMPVSTAITWTLFGLLMVMWFIAANVTTGALPWVITAALGLAVGLSAHLGKRHQTHRRSLYRSGGQTREIDQLLQPTAQVAAPDTSADGVNAVKEEYGALLSDIVYRIENPALFDVAAPTTRAFTTALLQWDNTASGLPVAERRALAARVRLTFDAARKHAETVGLRHIPDDVRDDVTRAAKALRLAASTTNEAEAVAARRGALAILQSLTLYYLPDPNEATAMIEGKPILALPGRRRGDE